MSAPRRADLLAPWLAGAFFALPVLIARYPPMDDLPLHEASVGLLRHWGDATFAPPSLYFVNIGHANQLFSLLVFALSYAMPIAWASKTVVAISMLLLPVAAGHFADHIGSSRWTALLVAPVGFGWLFFWGLVQNIVGLVALLTLLPAIDRFAARPTARGAAGMCGAMVLLHFSHEAMQLIACIALALCCVGTRPRARSVALLAVPIVACLGLIFVENVYVWRIAGPRSIKAASLLFYGFGHKVTSIPGVLFGGYEPWVRNLVMALAAVPLLVFAAARRRAAASGSSPALRLHAWRFELLGLLLFIVYLVAPANVRSTTLVYHRFLPPAWAILAVCSAARPAGTSASWPRFTPALCAVLPIASMLVAWPTFADSDRVFSDLDALMGLIQPGSAVLTLDLGPDPKFRLWNPMVAAGRVVAERGGRSMFDYTQSPLSPVAQRPEKQWAEPVDRMEHTPFQLRPDWDLTRFRYLLVGTEDPAIGAATILALRKDANLLAVQGEWCLFESRLPVVPIDSPGAPLPVPSPPNLRTMLVDAAREFRGMAR